MGNNKKLALMLLSATCILSMCMPVMAAECEHKNTEKTEQIDSSCTLPGYTEGFFCDDCEKYISGHKTIAGENTKKGA